VNPELFHADLAEKPARLRQLAAALKDGPLWPDLSSTSRVLLLGMGSSHYANLVAAARMRAAGVSAVAELASTDLLPRLDPGTLVIAVSASGGSAETLTAVGQLRASAPSDVRFLALTNAEQSPLAALCDDTVPLLCGVERGGVACRSYQHTLALLLALETALDGRAAGHEVLQRSAEATEHLLGTAAGWLPPLSEALLGPSGTWVVAPARRLSSALQSALMLREGPRLPAVGCETGDWSHVDVYLTKTLDYRMLLLPGSRWEPELLNWTRERRATVVAVGAALPDGAATRTLRYPHDDNDDVRLLTETLVAELIAATAWANQPG
jgi:fructoselysine-6-P-deglycase FrlB-like protein